MLLKPLPQETKPEVNRRRVLMRVIVVLAGVACIWSLIPRVTSSTRIASLNSGVANVAAMQTQNTQQEKPGIPDDLFSGDLFKPELTPDELSESDQQKAAELASSLASKISATEWLGPLAPIAISPFFGLTCLCGLSQFGGDWIGGNNFITTNPVLQNPVVLWVFLGLTILTTLPKLTKVSKPVAQLVDQLETYSAIVTLVVIRFAANIDLGDPSGEMASGAGVAGTQVMQMGFLSFTADTFLTIAAIINIIVINTIKFFFEVLVWLTPLPTVDALWEAASKGVCAALIGLYAWSPFVATILNLILFAVCAVAYVWVQRQVIIMKSMLGDPVWSRFSKSYGIPDKKQLTVFPRKSMGPFPTRAKVHLTPTETGWLLEQKRWFLPSRTMEISKVDTNLDISHRGFLINRIEMTGAETGSLLFSRRYEDLDTVSQLMGIGLSASKSEEALGEARAEFIS